MSRCKEIERSIIKKYRKSIWSKFIRSIQDYNLINDGDKIAVCISGGKDSMLLAKLMQEVHRHGKMQFELIFLCMDPGYNSINRQVILNNAKVLDIPLEIFESEIFDIVADMEESPCYMCARMRRGYLYKNAQMLGCNKIALGHHFDDVIETTLMSMFYNGQFKTMMPKLRSTNFENMQLIRPMYLIKESSIVDWMQYNELKFIQCACRLTENCVIGQGGGSKRSEIKNIIKMLKNQNSVIDANIFRSVHNINLDTIIGYKKRGKSITFEDYYNEGL